MKQFRWAGLALLLIACAAPMARAQDNAGPAPGTLLPGDVRPTLITLHVKNATMAKVVAEISKQSGANIEINGPQGASVTIDADQQPMLQVLSDAADQAHAIVQNSQAYPQDDAPHLQINFMSVDGSRFRAAAGPVMARFTGVEHLNQLTAPVESRDFCDVQVGMIWEPRLAVAYYEAQSTPTLAVDENGLSLVGDGTVSDPRQSAIEEFRSPNAQNRSGGGFPHSISLKVPPTAGRRLAHLTGRIRVWVVDRIQTLSIADLATAAKKPPTLTLSGSKNQLRVMGIWSSSNFIQLQMMPVQNTKASGGASQQAALLEAAKVRVLDASGSSWGQVAHVQQFGDPNDQQMIVTVQSQPGKNKEPKKVELDVPVSVNEIDVPYDLHDLPLP